MRRGRSQRARNLLLLSLSARALVVVVEWALSPESALVVEVAEAVQELREFLTRPICLLLSLYLFQPLEEVVARVVPAFQDRRG